jgi:hypothetical protein
VVNETRQEASRGRAQEGFLLARSIWDQGTYDHVLADKLVPQTVTEGIAAGHLEFVLHG